MLICLADRTAEPECGVVSATIPTVSLLSKAMPASLITQLASACRSTCARTHTQRYHLIVFANEFSLNINVSFDVKYAKANGMTHLSVSAP